MLYTSNDTLSGVINKLLQGKLLLIIFLESDFFQLKVVRPMRN